jgi:hypothetical protein
VFSKVFKTWRESGTRPSAHVSYDVNFNKMCKRWNLPSVGRAYGQGFCTYCMCKTFNQETVPCDWNSFVGEMIITDCFV